MRGVLVGLMLVGCSFGHHVGDQPAIDAPVVDPGAIDAFVAQGPDAGVPTTCLDGIRCKRKAITIHHGLVTGGPHADFPMLVKFHDAELKAGVRSDGFDLVFTAGDGTTRLPYERESYGAGGGDLLAWVRVPSLHDDADHVIYLYYGASTSTDQADPQDTWSQAYTAVYHLGEAAHATTWSDSTANHNDAGVVGGSDLASAPAQIGKGAALDSTDGLLSPQSATLSETATAGTISLWVDFKMASTAKYQSIMTTGNRFAGDFAGFELAVQPTSGNLYFYPNSAMPSDIYNLATAPFKDNTWAYLVVTLDSASSTVALFVDGVRLALATTKVNATTWTAPGMPTTWEWGNNTEGSSLAGSLDEIRVQRVPRTDGWITTEFANQTDPTKLATLGAEVLLTP